MKVRVLILGDALKRKRRTSCRTVDFREVLQFVFLTSDLLSVIMISRSLLLSSSAVLRRSTSSAGHRSFHILQRRAVPRAQWAFSIRAYATKSEADVKIEDITELSAYFPDLISQCTVDRL